MSRTDPFRIADYLAHILQAIRNIQDYTAGMSMGDFMLDRKTQDAVVRTLPTIVFLRHTSAFCSRNML